MGQDAGKAVSLEEYAEQEDFDQKAKPEVKEENKQEDPKEGGNG